ncbi:uncharacterized protein LOC143260776 [Megalopta genalis]|uniref:uncharacterized protein LOC143260776 n=1 Tax=Megalopta genalis TaxID=115081 RepID=UPI003FD54053
MTRSITDLAKDCARSSERSRNRRHNEAFAVIDEIHEQLAVRFLIKKSKRHKFRKYPPSRRQGLSTMVARTAASSTSEPVASTSSTSNSTSEIKESLQYLGLVPRTELKKRLTPLRCRHRTPAKPLFKEPLIYECCYCPKYFLHKMTYRQHVIRHIRKVYWCTKCKKGLKTMVEKKRHEYFCVRKVYQLNNIPQRLPNPRS